jgi:hypothetical protein
MLLIGAGRPGWQGSWVARAIVEVLVWLAVAALTIGPAVVLGEWLERSFGLPSWPMLGLGAFAFGLTALSMLSDRPRSGYLEIGPLAAIAAIGGALAALFFAARAAL